MLLELSRRELMRGIMGGISSALFPLDADNLRPTLKRVKVPVHGLDRRLDGMRIAQISDTHIGATLGLDHLERAVAEAMRIKPDLFVHTGDLLDDATLAPACLDIMARVRAPYGRFYVLGNHESYAGRDHVMATARRHAGFHFLVDQDTTISVQGARFHVSGLDYDISHEVRVPRWRGSLLPRYAYKRTFPDMQQQFQSFRDRLGESDFRLCLAHHPDYFEGAVPEGVDLTLSGHTHGGQVAPLGTQMAADAFDYVLGLYEKNGRHVYVNGGTGHWLPLRVGVPAEVTELTLVRV